MNSGRSGDKKYRAILLLVVGLAAFSSAMKELNQVREFTREARELVASLSKAVEPAPADVRVVPVEVPRTAARLEVCENSHPAPPAESMALETPPAGGVVHSETQSAQPMIESKDVGKPLVAARSAHREVKPATVQPGTADIDIVELRRLARRATDLKVMMADEDGGAEISVPDLPLRLPRIKELRQF